MDLGLAGRNALVAAATSGLGLGTARALVAEGANVSVCGRDGERLEGAVAELRASAREGAQVHGVQVDVRDEQALDRWVAGAEQSHGPTDIVVPNSGGPPRGTARDVTLDDYRRAVELNLWPSIALTERVLPGLRQRGWGRVLFIASVSVLDPLPDLALSNVARPGVVGYAKSVAAGVDDGSITVNVLAPGRHDTPRTTADGGLMGDPDHFGAVAAFLCSDQAGYVHGAVIPVDGGAHGGLP